ncbi:MAG TPA: penicillin-binding protein 2 [Acidobacteriaceae bacterium]|nr:penicillin-binding protein 2 [Acidobacteriaceae bacterium]
MSGMRDEKIPALKLAVVQYVIVAILAVLITGLWRLQILGASNWRELAEANRIRKVPILAPRGRLFDREGRLLVDNYPSVSCFLVQDQTQTMDVDLPKIARGLHMTVDQIQAILAKYRGGPKYQLVPLKSDITPDEKEFIEAHRDELPELETIDEQRRLYPRDGFAAALIGYTGEVSEDMLNQAKYAYYEPGDVVGRSGVEESYDALLRGTDGSRDVLVDSHGREVGRLGYERAIPGTDLKLSIDLDIQRTAELALGDRNGAVIAMDPHTGEVLALVSHPAFNPNDFAVRVQRDTWAKLITDPNHPLMDKAIQDQLAPGSTFKLVMSVAGLEEHVAQTLKVNCQGGANFYGRFFACDAHHGEVDINNAIPFSCDTYYYTLAQRLGIEPIAKWAHALGLGQKTGIDLPNEASGVVPSEEWKLKNYHEKWYAGEVISVGIGQGATAVTPVQLARTIGGIASGGAMRRPHVVMQDQLPENYRQAIVDSYPGAGDASVPISPAIWETITDGMAKVTDPTCGYCTGHLVHLEGIDFAGKTGTAQVVNHSFGAKAVSKDVSSRANSWFVGVAPRRNPDIVVAVLWEHGGWGAGSAKLAAQIIQAYVDKQRQQEHNVLQVEAQPKPEAPSGQLGAGAPAKKTVPAKPTEVGAIWSDPADPDAMGGRRVKAARPQDAKRLASVRAGRFFLADVRPDGIGEPKATPTAEGAR